jgi:maltose alpha-D-glucosyltransferase/alpha-amylase
VLPLVTTPAEKLPEGTGSIARLKGKGRELLVCEAMWSPKFNATLLSTIVRRKTIDSAEGEMRGMTSSALKRRKARTGLPASVLQVEQNNTSILYGDQYFLKLLRKLEAGVSLDYEVGRFLTEKTDFRNCPVLFGALQYERPKSEPSTIAILQQQIPKAGDAWKFTLDTLGRYFEAIASRKVEELRAELPSAPLVELASRPLSPLMTELLGPYLGAAELLGQRVGELHLALASGIDHPAFRPEPFTLHYQRSIYQRMRAESIQSLQLLRKRLRDLPDAARADAEAVLAKEPDIQQRFRAIIGQKISGLRIRCHGDLHLGKVLYTGKDFYIIDFEGEPSRPISERRLKRSPLRDVADMIRSFHRSAYAVLQGRAEGVSIRSEDASAHLIGTSLFYNWVSAVFLRSYLSTAIAGSFLPATPREVDTLLDAYVLEKALFELASELNNRPDWVQISLRGMLETLGRSR